MPRVHYVQKARKDNPAVSKGEPYFWWKPFHGGKRYSRTRPRPSQLCSGRKAEVMAAQETLADGLADLSVFPDPEDAFCAGENYADECAGALRDLADEYEESADNMPESLQWSEQAENMRAMADSLRAAADEIEYVEWECPDFDRSDDQPSLEETLEDEEPLPQSYGSDDEYDDAYAEWEEERERQYEDDLAEWESERDDWYAECEDAFETARDEAISASEEVEFYF